MSDENQSWVGSGSLAGAGPVHAAPEPEQIIEEDSREERAKFAQGLVEKWRSEGRNEKTGELVQEIDRSYRYADGRPVPKDKTLKPAELASDLARTYELESAQAEQLQNDQVANAVDEARLSYNLQNSPELAARLEQLQQQQTEQPQSDQPAEQQPSNITPSLQAKLQDAELRSAVEAEVSEAQQKIEYANAASEQIRAQYTAATMQMAKSAAASLLANFPELQGLSPDQIGTALQVVKNSDPARHALIEQHLNNVAGIYRQAQAAQQAQAELQRANFARFSQEQDKVFEQTAEKEYGKERVAAAKRAIVDIAKETYGISPEELAHLYQTQPILRTAPMQRMMMDAALYRMAQKTATANPVRTVPATQKPGTAKPAVNALDEEIAKLDRRLTKTGSPKDATALRLAKMRARGG